MLHSSAPLTYKAAIAPVNNCFAVIAQQIYFQARIPYKHMWMHASALSMHGSALTSHSSSKARGSFASSLSHTRHSDIAFSRVSAYLALALPPVTALVVDSGCLMGCTRRLLAVAHMCRMRTRCAGVHVVPPRDDSRIPSAISSASPSSRSNRRSARSTYTSVGANRRERVCACASLLAHACVLTCVCVQVAGVAAEPMVV